MEEITAVHDPAYIQQLEETIQTQAPTVVADFDDPDGFTYVTSTSFDDARKVITVLLSVLHAALHLPFTGKPCAIKAQGALPRLMGIAGSGPPPISVPHWPPFSNVWSVAKANSAHPAQM